MLFNDNQSLLNKHGGVQRLSTGKHCHHMANIKTNPLFMKCYIDIILNYYTNKSRSIILSWPQVIMAYHDSHSLQSSVSPAWGHCSESLTSTFLSPSDSNCPLLCKHFLWLSPGVPGTQSTKRLAWEHQGSTKVSTVRKVQEYRQLFPTYLKSVCILTHGDVEWLMHMESSHAGYANLLSIALTLKRQWKRKEMYSNKIRQPLS